MVIKDHYLYITTVQLQDSTIILPQSHKKKNKNKQTNNSDLQYLTTSLCQRFSLMELSLRVVQFAMMKSNL